MSYNFSKSRPTVGAGRGFHPARLSSDAGLRGTHLNEHVNIVISESISPVMVRGLVSRNPFWLIRRTDRASHFSSITSPKSRSRSSVATTNSQQRCSVSCVGPTRTHSEEERSRSNDMAHRVRHRLPPSNIPLCIIRV